MDQNTELNLPELSINDFYQTGESGYLQNLEALEYLRNKRELWYKLSQLATIAATTTAIFSLGFASGGAAAALKAMIIATSFDRLISICELLLETFKDGITIIPRVQTNVGEIELFIRTIDGRLFAFESRSKGTSKVKWRQDRQDFFISSNRKTHKWGELASIGKNLNEAVVSLKKQKNEIVGKTNTQLRKPVIKAIILTGKTQIDPNNDSELFADFGKIKKDDSKLLRVATQNTIYLLNQNDLVNFLLPPDKEFTRE